MPNQLANSKSPYLLQHKDNPVHWYEWGEEAFLLAKQRNLPIFLSIGYSTCHWCHVMAHESFEDDEVALLLNTNFISIKLDREERPDLDNIYMNVCQMLTGSGGWPLSIFMTPDRKPFFAGTYFPKKSNYGRIGFIDLMLKINDLWKNNYFEILESANDITNSLANNLGDKDSVINQHIAELGFSKLEQSFDDNYGGFGTRPKFPMPQNYLFLLEYFKKTNDTKALYLAEKSLNEMRSGGIYDQIGFGFHRYSTDERWLVPHFEKMLYDNTWMMQVYTALFEATGKAQYKTIVEEIAEYLCRDLRHPAGGFFSAEDADSEGQEGKFYVWNEKELKEILEVDFAFVQKVFNTNEEGNFLHENHHTPDGTNIFFRTKSNSELAQQFEMSETAFTEKLNSISAMLLFERSIRIRPHRDEKILTDWNGIAISSFAKAGLVFGNAAFIQTAEECARFILSNCFDKGKLYHRIYESEAGIDAMMDDYTSFVYGLVNLYKATLNNEYLEKAVYFQNQLDENFWDEENWGYFLSNKNSSDVIARTKDNFDNAVPAAANIALNNLFELHLLTGDLQYKHRFDELLTASAKLCNSYPTAFLTLIYTLLKSEQDNGIIVVSLPEKKNLDLENLKKLAKTKRILIKQSDSQFYSEYKAIDGKITYYECRDYKCDLPKFSLD